jgi:5,10-methylenetetrahydromethanopterin reductase
LQACIHHISEVKVGGTANPVVVSRLRSVIDEAASQMERDPAGIGLVVGAVTVVDKDAASAQALARREAALYLSIIAKLDHNLNLDMDELALIDHSTANHDYETVAQCITDDLLKKLTFVGTPDDIAEQVAMLFAAGASRIEFGTPHGLTTERGLHLLGERVLAALRGPSQGSKL